MVHEATLTRIANEIAGFFKMMNPVVERYNTEPFPSVFVYIDIRKHRGEIDTKLLDRIRSYRLFGGYRIKDIVFGFDEETTNLILMPIIVPYEEGGNED